MDLNTASMLAHKLLDSNGLTAKGWKFEFDRATSRLGSCNYLHKKITLSKHMTQAAEYHLVEQTLLHEIAHASLPYHDSNGKKTGHGKLWKEKAASLGYTGKTTSVNPYKPPIKPKPSVPIKTRKGTILVNVGDDVLLPKGLRGTITKIARTRFHVDVAGKIYSVHFTNVTPLSGKTA